LITDFDSVYAKHRRTILVFCIAFIVLIGNRYLAETSLLLSFLDFAGFDNLLGKANDVFVYSEHARFNSLLYWVFTLDFFYLLIPVIVIRFFLKERVRDYGLNFHVEKGFFKYFFLFMLVMLTLVYFASTTQAFQGKYP